MPLVRSHLLATLDEHPGLAGKRLACEVIRRMLSAQVYDIIDATCAALRAAAPQMRTGARCLSRSFAFRPDARLRARASSACLREPYRHPQVLENARVLSKLSEICSRTTWLTRFAGRLPRR